MSNPLPLPLFDGVLYAALITYLSELFVLDGVWPSDLQDLSRTFIDEDLQLLCKCLR